MQHLMFARKPLTLAALLLAGSVLLTTHATAQITLPSGNAPFLDLFGDGVQIYNSAADTAHPGAFVWSFIAPQANLYTDASETTLFGTHFAGPTWHDNADGSEVVGMRIGSKPSSHPNSIPELLLSAKSHAGTGMFQKTTFIQRLDTVGGNASSTLPTGLGQRFDSPYTALYRFSQAVPEPGVTTMVIGVLLFGGTLGLFRHRKR